MRSQLLVVPCGERSGVCAVGMEWSRSRGVEWPLVPSRGRERRAAGRRGLPRPMS